MRLAFVSLGSPFDKSAWSGIPFYALKEVTRRFPDTHVIDTPRADRMLRRLSRLARFGVLPSREPLVVQRFGRIVNRELEKLRPDAVVAVGAAHKVAYIDPAWPMIYVADAMFATVIRYYAKYTRLGGRTIRNGNAIQRELLARANSIMLTSDWAVRSAATEYGLPLSRFDVAPIGANLDRDPGYTEPRNGGPLSMLFVGFDWQRKGGPLVLDVWKELRRRTGDAELHIVGCSPPEAAGQSGIHIHGVLRKSVPEQSRVLEELYRACSFLFMPSRQEAYGIVYCEAAAFGKPSIATDTGGVPTIINDGKTGILLPVDATAEDYADRIIAAWDGRERYRHMCEAARQDYETRLNWSAWGGALSAALERVAGARG